LPFHLDFRGDLCYRTVVFLASWEWVSAIEGRRDCQAVGKEDTRESKSMSVDPFRGWACDVARRPQTAVHQRVTYLREQEQEEERREEKKRGNRNQDGAEFSTL
jgi:hypothetical protein